MSSTSSAVQRWRQRRQRQAASSSVVQRNRVWAGRLGWLSERDRVARQLGLPPGSPAPDAFVAALRHWQNEQGLPATGVLGPSAWRHMQSLLAAPDAEGETGAACQCPACTQGAEEEVWDTVKDWFGTTFGSGTCSIRGSKDFNKWVQSGLNKILKLKLGVDGVLGAQSLAAIRDFQGKKGLSVSGVVDSATEKALIAGGAGEPPIPGRKTSGVPQAIGNADFAKHAKAYKKWVQESLNRVLGLKLAVDGNFGAVSKAALRDFQKSVGISASGEINCLTEGKLIQKNGCRKPYPYVNTQLPAEGLGFYSYKPTVRHKQYGLPETIAALINVGKRWAVSHATGPRIGIGEISVEGGGCIYGHASHQMGVDVDIHLVRKDSKEAASNIHDKSSYSREWTQELVDLIRTNKALGAKRIFLNDSSVKGVQFQKNHDNHIHVRFEMPARIPV